MSRELRPVRELNNAEAVMGFAAWLTTLENPVIFGSHHECAIAAELVGMFCEANNLKEIRPNYTDALTHPKQPS